MLALRSFSIYESADSTAALDAALQATPGLSQKLEVKGLTSSILRAPKAPPSSARGSAYDDALKGKFVKKDPSAGEMEGIERITFPALPRPDHALSARIHAVKVVLHQSPAPLANLGSDLDPPFSSSLLQDFHGVITHELL